MVLTIKEQLLLEELENNTITNIALDTINKYILLIEDENNQPDTNTKPSKENIKKSFEENKKYISEARGKNANEVLTKVTPSVNLGNHNKVKEDTIKMMKSVPPETHIVVSKSLRTNMKDVKNIKAGDIRHLVSQSVKSVIAESSKAENQITDKRFKSTNKEDLKKEDKSKSSLLGKTGQVLIIGTISVIILNALGLILDIKMPNPFDLENVSKRNAGEGFTHVEGYVTNSINSLTDNKLAILPMAIATFIFNYFIAKKNLHVFIFKASLTLFFLGTLFGLIFLAISSPALIPVFLKFTFFSVLPVIFVAFIFQLILRFIKTKTDDSSLKKDGEKKTFSFIYIFFFIYIIINLIFSFSGIDMTQFYKAFYINRLSIF